MFSIVLGAKEKIRSTNLLAFYVERINTKKGISKYLADVVNDKNIDKYSNFDELYKYFDKISMGYDRNDIANPKDMEKYYSKKEQDKYGVIGIEVRVIEDRK